MLATVPRAAPRAARRALTTATALRAPLAPPYAHANRSALAPPYTHPLASPVRDEDRLKAPYAFSVPRNSQTATGPSSREWVAAVFDTAAGREWAMSAWESALVELAEQPATAPEIPFQALTAVLADPNMQSLVARTGAVVVRDVVRDALAEAWAKELIEARAARGHATFYNQAQVDARADPSVLSAAGQLLRALVPEVANAETAYVRVDAAAAGPSSSNWTGKSVWAVDNTTAGFTPVHAHLTLQRTDVAVPTSTAAATYALLRPFFAPKASRISFYHAEDYLNGKNWQLRQSATGPDYDAPLVHIRPAAVSLAPGDVLITHAGLNVAAADTAGLVLPVHPLPATEGNAQFVKLQRASFEAGVPPPHAETADSPIALEEAGDASMIASWGGRRAMGYGF